MNPLIEKYFRGELTVPEETNLEDLLTESEEAAWDFGQAAEEAYHRYGLPEPDLPGGEGADSGKGGGSPLPWMIPLLGILFLGGFWWWKQARILAPVKEPSLTQPAPAQEPVKRTVHRGPAPIVNRMEGAPAKEAPRELPPEAQAEKEAGNNLKVVVKRESPGAATVRVVNSLGVEVRSLYSGTLQAGRWSFEWDGRGSDGQLVEPGKYYIQVVTEAGTQSREVNIK